MNTPNIPELPPSAGARRADKLRLLLDGFARGEMDLAAVALLLDCSASSARNYVLELVDAGLLTSSRGGPVRGRVASAIYRLKRPDQDHGGASAGGVPAAMLKAPRDPLVMALFGGSRQSH
jgi:predicted ArsR family transcriptional regulator